MPSRKSPAWHAAASCFLPGLGTILCGRTKRGLLIFGLSAFLLIGVNLLANALTGGEPKGIGTFLALPVWVWGMVDGHRSAQQWNREHPIQTAAGGHTGNGSPSQSHMSPALDPGARIIPQADPHAQPHRAPNDPSIVLTAASDQMVTQLTSDRYFLMGVLMGDPRSEARTFMAALDEGTVTHEVSRDPAGPGFIVRLTITKNAP